MGWIRQSDDSRMPDWLKNSLEAKCTYCGSEKENFYNDRGECTNRRCPNPECPGTIAQRIADMCEFLGVKGIKEGRGLQMVRDYDLKNHYQALPRIVTEKPKMYLSGFMRISFIRGIDTAWDGLCGTSNTLDELYANVNSEVQSVLDRYMDVLREGIQYVEILPREVYEFKPVISGNVMITGAIPGFTNRDNYVYAFNRIGRGLVNFRVVGKRKTDVLCLIKQADAPNTGKTECALENGIPIMTPEEFKEWVERKLTEWFESRNGGKQ